MLITSDKRIYLDKKGRVVREDDPTQAYLLVCEGGQIEESRLLELGCTVLFGKIYLPGEVQTIDAGSSNASSGYTRPIWPTTIGRIIKKIFKIK